MFVGVNLFGLTRSPIFWGDEAVVNEPAKELALHGAFRSMVFAGSQKLEELYAWQPPGYPLMMAAVIKLFGFGIWQLRLPSLLFGGASVALLFILTTEIGRDRLAGILAAMLLGLEPSFLMTSRSARMDTACMAFVIAALIMFFRYRAAAGGRERMKRLLQSGVLTGVACMMHPFGGIWAIVILLLAIVARRHQWFRVALIYGAPTAVFLTAWIGLVVVLQSPSIFYRQFIQHGLAHVSRSSLFSRFQEGMTLMDTMYAGTPVYFLAFLIAIICLLRPPAVIREQRWIILSLIAAPLLWWLLVMTKGQATYFLHMSLVLFAVAGIGTGALYRSLANTGSRPIRMLTYTAGIVCLIHICASGLAGRIALLYRQWNERDHDIIDRVIHDAIPPGSRVWIHPEGPRGRWFIWPAIVRAGSTLHVLGRPFSENHDYAVTSPSEDSLMQHVAVKVAEISREEVKSLPFLFHRPVRDGIGGFPRISIWRIVSSESHK